MPQTINTYSDFKREVVDADFKDFMADDSGNLRKAWHCAGSLFHIHDWVYAAHKTSIDAKYTFVNDKNQTQAVSRASHFANSLGQQHPNFELIRGIANASMHCVLKTPPPGRIIQPGMPSSAANTYVTDTVFQPGAFQRNAFQVGDVMLQATPQDILFSDLARSVLQMWDQLFQAEGCKELTAHARRGAAHCCRRCPVARSAAC
jgi:hypothetical protein